MVFSNDSLSDVVQLAWKHTGMKITTNATDDFYETRLHLIHYDNSIITNFLYLSPKAIGSKACIAGFDLVANKLCELGSKREILVALSSLVEVQGLIPIFNHNIDGTLCTNLINSIKSKHGNSARVPLQELQDHLQLSLLANDDILNIEYRDKYSMPSPVLGQEDAALKITLGKIDVTQSLANMLRVGGQKDEDKLILTMDAQGIAKSSLLDLNDTIQAEIEIDSNSATIFGGRISDVRVDSSVAAVTITCGNHLASSLGDYIIPMLAANCNPKKTLYFMLRNTGFETDQIDMDGFDAPSLSGFYAVWMPIQNLKTSEPFGIADVTFESLDSEDRKAIEDSLDPTWSYLLDRTWARVYVNSTDHYEAYLVGSEKIDAALDVFGSVKADSRLGIPSNKGATPVDWHQKNQFPLVIRESWVYVRDVVTNETILTNVHHMQMNTEIEMDDSLRYRLETGTEHLQVLLQEPWLNLSKQEKGIVYAMHWLRRARDTGNETDKLMYLWNAIEFILGSVEMPHLFSQGDEELKAIKKTARHVIKKKNPFRNEKLTRLGNVLGMVNNPPLMSKLRYLTKENNIPIVEEEWIRIKSLRDKRNDLIHGNSSVQLDENELKKLAFIVYRVITGIVSKS